MSDLIDPLPDESGLIESVRRSLEQSGYPLEMRVAAEMRRHAPDAVEQSRYYRDPLTEKIRETDVVSSWSFGRSGQWVYVFLVAECKSKPSPWVVFDAGLESDSAAVTEPRDRTLLTDQGTGLIATLQESLVLRAPSGTSLFEGFLMPGAAPELLQPVGRGIGIAEVGKAAGGDRNGAWDAVLAATSAAQGVRADLTTGLGGLHGPWTIALIVPLVITSGALLACTLGNEGGLLIREMDRAELVVRTVSQERVRCVVVTEAGLPGLLRSASEAAREIHDAFPGWTHNGGKG